MKSRHASKKLKLDSTQTKDKIKKALPKRHIDVEDVEDLEE
jgi:hypothetical protein